MSRVTWNKGNIMRKEEEMSIAEAHKAAESAFQGIQLLANFMTERYENSLSGIKSSGFSGPG